MDGESENPFDAHLASELCWGSALSFGYFSLGATKEK
jgi:hypothetical protein